MSLHPERWNYRSAAIYCIILAYSNGIFTYITHDSAWHATDDNQTIPMESIIATLHNAAAVAGYLHVY